MVNVYDFFSGCGGASRGFQDAGLTVRLGIDNDADAAATFRKNFPKALFVQDDIRNILPQDLAQYVKGTSKKLFCGCAPCQPFSKQNKHKFRDDARIDLLQEFYRFVEYFLPDFIFVENVPGIQNFKIGISPLKYFLECLKKLGYKTPKVAIISAADYGVPQTRKRLIVIAALQYEINFPKPTHGVAAKKPYSTVGDWIHSLPRLNAGEINSIDPDHCATKLSDINLERIKATPEGGGRTDWPEKLKLACHKNHSGHTDVYGRLAFDKLSSTLTTKCLSYSNGRYGHPRENRAMSVREAACIQTFPRNFTFTGTITAKARQIGNAVPPLLAQRIGEVFATLCKSDVLY